MKFEFYVHLRHTGVASLHVSGFATRQPLECVDAERAEVYLHNYLREVHAMKVVTIYGRKEGAGRMNPDGLAVKDSYSAIETVVSKNFLENCIATGQCYQLKE